MKSSYKFCDLIEEVSERNANLEYGLDDIVGVTIDKGIISTVANLTQTALDKFYVIRRKTFIYNPRTHGVKLGMGYNDTDNVYITTWNNIAFRVKDSVKDILNPDYLWLYFNRSEWDRETNYNAWGSSTIVFSWSIFLNLTIELPDKEFQDTIVSQYNRISHRIDVLRQLNDNLEMQIQVLFNTLFMSNDDYNSQLCDFSEINPTRQLCKNELAKCFDMATLPQKGCIPFGAEVKPYNGGMKFKNGDTILARITPCLENGKAAYINILEENEIAFGSTEFIVLAPKCNFPSSFFYFLVRNERFITFAISHR